ncbi:hypothetical protein AY601_4055 [Pedobacter cryoconitis]|uniref:Uncharacterized protein n=1 Tax=Pedobacter cryoconitis TaxID=188932 RepID=A0A127VHV6_9SPHI|nr:hypothetical protein [Pedobacter cryoconitis]AMQ00906.1 hypothetical protein AY601_4055 [Pedobacter cryoconitis]
MATTTEKRVNVSTRTQKNDSMDFKGWKLSFQYSFESEKQVNDVQVNGVQSNIDSVSGETQCYFSYSKNGTNINISFSNTECDNALVAAVKTEVDIITASL